MTSTDSKKLSCPLGASPGNAGTGHTDRGVVPGRDAGGAEEQAHLSLGQERFTPAGRLRPAYPIDLSVRRGLSRARHRLRPGAAGLQPRGHAVSSRCDCTPGRAGGTRHSPSRPRRLAWCQGAQGAEQYLAHAVAGARPNSTRRRTSGSSCGKTGSLTASSNPTTTSSTTVLRLEHSPRSALENHVHRSARLGKRTSVILRIGLMPGILIKLDHLEFYLNYPRII